MIYIVPVGGLGNVLSVSASVYALRQDGFTNIGMYLQRHKQQPLSFDEIFKSFPVPVYHTLPPSYIRYDSEDSNIPKKEFEILSSEYDNLLITTCLPFYKPHEIEFYTQFSFLDEYMDYSNKLITNHHKTVGVHIRRGDFITENRELSEIDSFKTLMNKEIERDSDVQFFVATDELILEEELRTHFGENRIIVHKKQHGYDRASKEYAKDGIYDFIALSSCSKIIGSKGSSFSINASKIHSVPLVFA